MKHKGYEGTVEYSEEDQILHGEIIGINDMVTYEGASVAELMQNFSYAVDGYLQVCETTGKNPDKPYKGSFSVRMTAAIHRKASMEAAKQGISLNKFIERATRKSLNEA